MPFAPSDPRLTGVYESKSKSVKKAWRVTWRMILRARMTPPATVSPSYFFMLRKAATTFGSNWMPLNFSNSPLATSSGSGSR